MLFEWGTNLPSSIPKTRISGLTTPNRLWIRNHYKVNEKQRAPQKEGEK
jgi:hypothetical protein